MKVILIFLFVLQMLSAVLNIIMFEDCRNQWSMSRPLLALILLNEEVSDLKIINILFFNFILFLPWQGLVFLLVRSVPPCLNVLILIYLFLKTIARNIS